ncbi:tetratricopeptide repeat protein [Nodosilinea sp. FACHB-13]|uniref:tetratricopeptide repeat protein n=1 Tax=Cyanophyceae TaxID=3028117 RepID=UPI001689FE46|nr:tetratricopeptide repeat protein [Nodosilinea sp. FACHB-13]MBD2108529.1 tetratricopeptide repeat protein [Nodosilinea sp. FACHB-13]
MVSPDKSQEVLKDLSAGRDISIGDVSVEMKSYIGPQEIIVSGVGESPPNFEATWVNREAVQVELRNRLTRDPVTEIVAVGGFGKSWLAAWAYAELATDFDKRLWVNFRRELWQAYGFDRFARWILQEIGFPQKDPAAKEDLLLRELTYRLNDQNRPVKTLVVMDNVESLRQSTDWPWFEQFLQTWARQGQCSRLLVTTRPASITSMSFELSGLSLTEGTAFLQREGLTGDCIAELVELADGHPLLLNLAAAWVRQTPGAKVDDSAVTFFSQLFEPYRRDATSLAEAKVELIFEQVFEALPEPWKDMLLRVSVYRLPFDLAMAQAMEETVTLEDLQGLVAQALLVKEDQRFTLHALIAELVQDWVSDTVKKEAHEQAIAYYQAHYRSWDGAIASCQEELEAFYHAVELGQYGWAYKVLDRCADLLQRAGYWRDLVPICQMLTQHWQPESEKETQDLGWVWNQLAGLHLNLGDYQLAVEIYQRAKVLFTSIAYRDGEAAVLGNLGNAYRSLGQYQQAIKFHQQHHDIARETGNRGSEAASLSNLGAVYQFLGQYQRAIEFLQQSLVIAREIGARGSEAASLCNLGVAYRSLRQYQQAIEFLQQSLVIAREIGDRCGEAKSLGNLGNAYQSLGQYQQAIEFFQQSLVIAREIGDRDSEAASIGNLGSAYQSLGQYQRAIEFHQQQHDIAREIDDRGGKAKSLSNLGVAYQFLGQYQQAIKFYQQALKIKREIGDRGSEASSHWSLANAYQQRGRLKLAMEHRRQAYRAWHDMQLPLAAAPFPNWTKNIIQNLSDDWAEQQIANEKRMEWLFLPLGYFLFILRTAFSPLIWLQKRLKVHPLMFWFALGVALVLLVAWLR